MSLSAQQRTADSSGAGSADGPSRARTNGQHEQKSRDQHELGRDEVYDLLSSHRRRFAVHALKRADGDVELSDLAEQVAAWENDKTVPEVTSTERHRVYTSMQQTHLPVMERAGVIEHERGTITPTEAVESLEVYLDVVPEESIPWAQYYLGLSVLSAGLLVAAGAGVFPESVPGLAWGGLIVALFGISAAYHVWQSRRMRLGASETPPEVNYE